MDELAPLAERLAPIEKMRYFGGMVPALRTLLDEALALPAAERTTWLESLTGEQVPLKDTLRELLAAYGQVETGSFQPTPREVGVRAMPRSTTTDSRPATWSAPTD